MTSFEKKFRKFRGPFLIVGGRSSNLAIGDIVYLFQDDGSNVPLFTKNQRFDEETSFHSMKKAGSTWGCRFLEQIIPIDPAMGLDLLLMLYPEHRGLIEKIFESDTYKNIDIKIQSV